MNWAYAEWHEAYDALDRVLRNMLDDDAYARYSEYLGKVWNASAAPVVAAPQEPTDTRAKALDGQELRRAVAQIGVVGQIDGHDVVRRLSVLDIVDRRMK